jgi:hypothetical protein
MTTVADNETVDQAFRVLYEIFSAPEAARFAHRSCPIDAPSEFDLAFEEAKEEVFGPDLEYRAWVDSLRRAGLITW